MQTRKDPHSIEPSGSLAGIVNAVGDNVPRELTRQLTHNQRAGASVATLAPAGIDFQNATGNSGTSSFASQVNAWAYEVTHPGVGNGRIN